MIRPLRYFSLLLTGTVLLILLTIGFVLYAVLTNKPAEPCTEPCIKLVTASNDIFLLNDFRFAEGHCLLFISLPDHVSRKTCGEYNLIWIAPES